MKKTTDLLAKEFTSKSKVLKAKRLQKLSNAIGVLSLVLIGFALYVPNRRVQLLIIVLSSAFGVGIHIYSYIQNLKIIDYLESSSDDLLYRAREILDSDEK